MSIFKRISLFWYVTAGLEVFLCALTWRQMNRDPMLYLFALFQDMLNEITLLAVAIPIFAGIILKETALSNLWILRLGGRGAWKRQIEKRILIISGIYTILLLLPLSIVWLIFGYRVDLAMNLTYFGLSLLGYFFSFNIIAFVIGIIKLKWNKDVLAFLVAYALCFMPFVVTKILRFVPIDYSSIVNSSLLTHANGYQWVQHAIICGWMAIVAFLCQRVITVQSNRKDIMM
ncbi:MAG: hypothetical protein K6G13_05830 [Agathobacter sp.]|uniref:hypothetical protein n=1 Tax=Agathobacter sp. TaxID=2021311 RepID=UPI00258E0AAB|nr:hypothetical protein [Agathobacter sp.]MCR5677535.1 hypothetical protein [Agathobacter sp.]